MVAMHGEVDVIRFDFENINEEEECIMKMWKRVR